MLSAQRYWNKMKTQIYSKSCSCKGMNESTAALVHGLKLPFAVNSSKHYIKFVARDDSCYKVHSDFFLPWSLFHSLSSWIDKLWVTSEKLRSITFTGMDQWSNSYFLHSKEGKFFSIWIFFTLNTFGECAVLWISW